MTAQIQEVIADSDQTYVSRRVYQELKEQRIPCSEKRIARLMRVSDLDLYAVTAKRFVVSTDSNPALPIGDGVLEREFSVETPNPRWTRI